MIGQNASLSVLLFFGVVFTGAASENMSMAALPLLIPTKPELLPRTLPFHSVAHSHT